MMGHNVECHIRAVQRAQQLMDIECARFKPDWRLWGVEGKREVEYSDWVPRKILYFGRFIEELFNTSSKEEAFQMIKDAELFLKSLEGARLQGGPAGNTFNDLFSYEDGKKTKEDEFDQHDDDELNKLQAELDQEK